MFSFACCGNVLKQIVDVSNAVSVVLSDSMIFERDVSNEQVHVTTAMQIFLNETVKDVVKDVAIKDVAIKDVVEDVAIKVVAIKDVVEDVGSINYVI